MTFPATDVGTTNTDGTLDNPSLARADVLDLMTKFNQLRNHITTLGQTLLNRATAALMRADLGVAPRATRIDVASVAGAVNLTTAAPDTDDIRITGSLSITSFTIAIGRDVYVTAGASHTLVNSASIVTNTGANILCIAGDSYTLRATAANVVEVIGYSSISLNGVTAVAARTYLGVPASNKVFGYTDYQVYDVSSLRTLGVNATNAAGRPIFASISLKSTVAGVLYSYINGLNWQKIDVAANTLASLYVPVPDGATYQFYYSAGTITIDYWKELS